MFGKRKNETEIRREALNTLIGAGTLVEGTLKAEKSVRIDGLFQGELFCSGNLRINSSSEVNAQIEGMDIYINGTVCGTVSGERVELDRQACLIGDLYTGTLVIAEGALFQGCSMDMGDVI